MVNPRSKGNFRRLEWVIVRVVNVEKENASIIRRACVFSMYFEEEEEERNVLVKKKTKKMKKKKKKKNVHVPGGPRIVLTHSYKLSPFGPALQFVGGSKLISASSFWMRFAAELIPALLIFSF